jgi:hypothetical protein
MEARLGFLPKFKSVVAPVLKEEGFRATGNYFRRQVKEVIHVVQLQTDVGVRCWINLGIHLAFLPTKHSNSTSDPKKISLLECEFQARMDRSGVIYAPWYENSAYWPFGNSEEEDEASVLSIKDTYLNVGRPFFTQFLVFPKDFTRLTPETFATRTNSIFPPSTSEAYALLTQARIYHHLGTRELVSRFIEMGLAKATNGLEVEFEKIRGAS